jgi:BASS family bile acid:Na+ symporter
VSVLAVGLLLIASMTAVGTAVTVADFRALATRRAVLAVAVVVNVLVVPGLAVAVCAAADLAPATTLGIVLAAAAPGGGTGALLTLHARGDLALSAALQGVLAPLGLVSAPLWAQLSGRDVVPSGWAGAGLVAGGLVGQLVPLAVGMWLRRRDPEHAARVHRVARRIADVLLAGLVVYFLVTAGGQLPALGWPPIAVTALLVGVCLSATAIPWLGRPAARRAVGMTSAVRNLSLALFIATPAGAGVVVALLAYGLVMYVLSVPVAVRLGRAATV